MRQGYFLHANVHEYFNPRTPCGVRRSGKGGTREAFEFQSTHSMRSATKLERERERPKLISIHALHAECDQKTIRQPPAFTNFNPRTPCGVRPGRHSPLACPWLISIHALHAECDLDPNGSDTDDPISIHALHAECDGEYLLQAGEQFISIHALHAECDDAI